MFLLVPAHPGSPRQRAVKRSLLLLLLLFINNKRVLPYVQQIMESFWQFEDNTSSFGQLTGFGLAWV